MSQPATATTMADNFFLEAMKPAFREDPYPFYERFRGTAPLLRVADTIWFALGHAEVTAMLRHPRLSTDEMQHATTKAGRAPDPNRARSLLFMDPPDHTRLRGLVARAFTPRRIEDLRAASEGITNELIEAMSAQRGGTVDLIEAFAYPLPVRVICTLLGVPARDEAIFTEWSRGIARSVDPSILRGPEIEAAIAEPSGCMARCRMRKSAVWKSRCSAPAASMGTRRPSTVKPWGRTSHRAKRAIPM